MDQQQGSTSSVDKSVDNWDDENSLTMLDVLQEENQLEEDAFAVLGTADEENCTYNKGYIRQALYACKTCCPKGIWAGVCLACSFHCHEGHELIELYTKRHFRCDCGNSKFEGKKCTLCPTKSELNEENKYDQNFDGTYCTCARPYPDPESLDNDEMLQCAICEDWYHFKHLKYDKSKPEENDFDEMVCNNCMTRVSFLWNYASKYSVRNDSKLDKSITDDESVEVERSPDVCTMPTEKPSETEGSCFWIEGWRSALCTCEKCKELYREHQVEFLLEPTDSVQAYESAGKGENRESQYEKGMKALASLDRVQQVNVIGEYNIMKERLKEYLKKFVDSKKVVRAEDIQEFFSDLEPNKRVSNNKSRKK